MIEPLSQWPQVDLASVVVPRKIKVPPSSLGNVPFVGLEHVEAHSARIVGSGRAADMKSAVAVFEAGDVLYGRLRPYLNKVVKPNFSGAASAEFIVIPGNERMDAGFLHQLLMHPDFVRFASGINQGDRPRVHFDQIGQFRFRLPTIDEQRRIVAKLDKLSACSKSIRDELAHVPKLVERYKQAVLTAAFSGKLAGSYAAGEFERRPFKDVIASTFYGPRIASEAYVHDGIPTLRTTDIGDWGELTPQSPPQVRVTAQELEKWGFRDQDLMVTRTGATIGKCALYRRALGAALPSAYLIRVRLRLDTVDGKYALLFLLSPDGQKQLLSGRTAVAQPNINARAIASLSIPLSGLELQIQTVRQIEAAFSWVDKVALEYSRAAHLLQGLDRAILAKAFRGELVPTADPP